MFTSSANAHSMGLDLGRLRSSLAAAATRAGYQSWWLIDDLIEGLACYLRFESTIHPGDHGNLVELIQTMLKAIGYQEIASQYQSPPPHQAVSLVECLHGVARSSRSRFFDKLAGEISLLHAARARRIYFCDLQACIHELQQLRPSSRTVDGRYQLGVVVAFIRERVQALWHSQEVQCSIV